MTSSETDVAFLELVIRQEEITGRAMPLDSLIILSRLRQERRLTTADLVSSTQKLEQKTRAALEKLTEAGLVDAHGTGRGRTYTLSAGVYSKAGQKADYVRQTGFDLIQQEQMVINYIDRLGSIKRRDVMELCRITKDQAYKLLSRLKENGQIEQVGERKGAVYRAETLKEYAWRKYMRLALKKAHNL